MSDDAEVKHRYIKVFGWSIKAEMNLNTIISVFTLLSMAGGGAWVAFTVVKTPIDTANKVDQLRSEIGSPGQPNYIPGMVRGMRHDMTDLQRQMKDNHDDTARSLQDISDTLKAQGKDTAQRFDRIDGRIDNVGTRIDRFVESGAVQHRPR